MKACIEAAQTGMDSKRAMESLSGDLDGTPRSPTGRNAAYMHGASAALKAS